VDSGERRRDISTPPEPFFPDLVMNSTMDWPALSPLEHFATATRILDKTKQLVPPRPNVFQQRLARAYETLMALAVPVRLLGLKIRQCGGTTMASFLGYHHCQRRNTDAVIVANVNANSREILSKMQGYGQTGSAHRRNPMRVRGGCVTWDNGSRAEITSAETLNTGISRTRQFALFSEACKYPRGGVKDDRRIMASVLPSVPDAPETCAIAESTPEGASGWFYDQWQGALTLEDFTAALRRGEAQPGNGWVKVFAAWFEFEDNRRAVSEGERRRIEGTLTPREARGRRHYGWTVEQIAWRRATIASECGGSEDAFDEYYPEDEVSCFLSSGRPRFNMKCVSDLEKAAPSRAPEEGGLDLQEDGGVSFTPDPAGYAPFTIWERPRPGCRYLVWCDPATGEDQTEGRDPDRHSIGVLRAGYAERDGVEQKAAVVARVRPPFDAEGTEVARRIVALSKFYGDCLVVLEVNMGLHILALLKEAGVPLYKREVIDPHDRTQRRLMYGWKLKDRDQRRAVIDCLALALQDGTIDIWCPHILAECKTFIIDKNGKEIARSGCHDDDVMGLAMAKYCEGSATLYRPELRKRRKPADWHQWKRH
jgi:hypothetical protein